MRHVLRFQNFSVLSVRCVYLTNPSLTKMSCHTSLSCVTDGIRRGYRGDRGSECLGLASGPRLSLVRLGDRLVRALASNYTVSSYEAMSSDYTVSSDKRACQVGAGCC